MADTVWYVGYGSNLNPDRFWRYLEDARLKPHLRRSRVNG